MASERTVIGLDIGSHRIKAVEARGGKRPRVRKTAEVPTPVGAVKDGLVLHTDRLATAIKSALERLKPTTKEVAVAVGGSAFLRRMPLPNMPEDELRSMLELQQERYIPFAKEGAAFDLAVLGDAGNGEINVLVAAAPTRAVEALMDACKGAGLKLVKIDVETLALARAVVSAGLATERDSIGILDIGSGEARLSLYDGGTFVLARNLELEASIRDLFATKEELPDLADQMANLFLDVRRSLDFGLAQFQAGGQLTRLLLVGGGADMPGLAAACQEYLRASTLRLDPTFAVMVPDLTALHMKPSHLLAFGLALAMEGANV